MSISFYILNRTKELQKARCDEYADSGFDKERFERSDESI